MAMYHIRPADLADVDSIASVARESWRYTYKAIYPQEVIDQFVSRAYSRENLTRSIEIDQKRAHRLFHVAVDVGGQIVAFSHAVPDPESDTSFELARIYALPTAHGTGVGTRLLRHLLDSVPILTELSAWVERDNAIGRRFYERHGFQAVGEKEEDLFGHKTVLVKYVLVRNKG